MSLRNEFSMKANSTSRDASARRFSPRPPSAANSRSRRTRSKYQEIHTSPRKDLGNKNVIEYHPGKDRTYLLGDVNAIQKTLALSRKRAQSEQGVRPFNPTKADTRINYQDMHESDQLVNIHSENLEDLDPTTSHIAVDIFRPVSMVRSGSRSVFSLRRRLKNKQQAQQRARFAKNRQIKDGPLFHTHDWAERMTRPHSIQGESPMHTNIQSHEVSTGNSSADSMSSQEMEEYTRLAADKELKNKQRAFNRATYADLAPKDLLIESPFCTDRPIVRPSSSSNMSMNSHNLMRSDDDSTKHTFFKSPILARRSRTRQQNHRDNVKGIRSELFGGVRHYVFHDNDSDIDSDEESSQEKNFLHTRNRRASDVSYTDVNNHSANYNVTPNDNDKNLFKSVNLKVFQTTAAHDEYLEGLRRQVEDLKSQNQTSANKLTYQIDMMLDPGWAPPGLEDTRAYFQTNEDPKSISKELCPSLQRYSPRFRRRLSYNYLL